jgi:RNA polymerase sigma factor (sigma-70 family)
MKVELKRNGVELPYLAEKMISRECHKLERMLYHFNPADMVLNIDFSRKDVACSISLILYLPGVTMSVCADNKTTIGSCGEAFRKLFTSVEEFKTVLRRKPEHRKISEKNATTISLHGNQEIIQNQLTDLFTKNYHRFYNYALREIRFRCYQGFTRPGDIMVVEVIDEALVRVADQLNVRFVAPHVLRSFYDEIRKAIDRHLDPGGGGIVPLEEIIEPEDIDKNYEEYYQPDELIKVEDIVIDEKAEIPEQKIEYEEIEVYIDKLLSQLPADWREAFILVEREGLHPKDLAENRGKSIRTVYQQIEMTRKFLRGKLVDAGFEWKERTNKTLRGTHSI